MVAKLRPAAVVLNGGLWRRMEGYRSEWPPGYARSVADAARSAVAPQHGLAMWRTTTPSASENTTHSWDNHFLDEAVGEAQLHTLDAWQLLHPLLSVDPLPFFDCNHPWPEVYTELNHVLLNMLC